MSNRPTQSGSTFWDADGDGALRRRFRALEGAVDGGLYELDADGRFVAVDDAFLEIVGYARDDVVGDRASLVLGDDIVGNLHRDGSGDGDEGLVRTDAVEVRTADGARVPCELRTSVLDADGEFDGAVGVVRPIEDRDRRRDVTDAGTERRDDESGRGDDDSETDRSDAGSETERADDDSGGNAYESITSALDDADIGVFVFDETFDLAWADETMEQYFGFDRDELIGRTQSDVLETVTDRLADPDAFEAAVPDADDDSDVDRLECHVAAGEDRPERWLEHWSKPIESGRFAGGRIELYTDVTDRKRSRGVPTQSEEEFASLVDAVEEYAIFRLDTDGRVVSWNQGAKKIKGYDRAEIVGEHFSTFYTDEDRAADVPEENLAAAAESGYTEDEGWRVRQDGTRFWANVTITAIRDDDGALQGFAKVTRDMTDRRERERRLQRERDLVEQILETSPVGITVVEPDGSTVRANDRMAEILDLSEAEMEGYAAGEIDMYDENGAFLPVAERPASRALETGEPVTNTEVRIDVAEDQSRWLSINAAPVADDEGDVRHIVVSATDVTQLKVQADRLERQRDELRTELDEVFERVDDAFFAVDTDWNFTYVNEALATLAGAPRSDLVGADVWEVFDDLDDTAFAEEVRRAMATGETVDAEVYYEPADAWLQAAVYPSETGLSVYLTDVTERKEARRRLQRRAEQQETVAHLGQLALETSDLDEFMAEASSLVTDALDVAYCEVLELDGSAGELTLREGSGWRDGVVRTTTVAAGDDSQAGYTLLSEEPIVVEDAAAETRFGETEFLSTHGVRSGVTTVIGSVDDPWGILGAHDTEPRSFTGEDVNYVQSVANILAEAIERREYRDELERTIERLEESNERLEQFAYAASHDLQEPLRMVSSYLQLIDQRYGEDLDEEAEEFLAYAVDGADRMRDMVEGLLQYSRVDTQGDPLEPVDAEAAVEDALADLEVKVAETGAEVSVDPLPRVLADPSQLRQVFQNLLDNALTYSGEDPPRVHVSAERCEAGSAAERRGTAAETAGDVWILSVADEGIGIAPTESERIFDVFDRAHSRDENTGTGIGLAICERIVERHGGEIWVESEPGEGATFFFSLPAAAPLEE